MSVKLQGGLGNQMLIAAYGLSKGCRTFDISSFDKDELRHYELDAYGLDIELVRDPDAEAGYFQDERLFNAELARRLFGFPRGVPNDACRKIAARMIEQNTCLMGVRRTDYLWPERINYHGVMPPEYYFEAFKLLPKNSKIYCFTDDIPWVRENFDIEIVDVNGPNEKHWDIWLGSLCKNAIVANSTFHWWQAWLGADRNGTVIAPKKWFADERVNSECTLVPERWIRI